MVNIQTRIEDHKNNEFNLELDLIRAEQEFVRSYERLQKIKSKIEFHFEAIQNLEQKMK